VLGRALRWAEPAGRWLRLGRAWLAWPGTLLGRARAVGRAGLLPTVGPGWFKKEKPFLLY